MICARKPSTVRWSEPTHAGMCAANQASARFSAAVTKLTCTRVAFLKEDAAADLVSLESVLVGIVI